MDSLFLSYGQPVPELWTACSLKCQLVYMLPGSLVVRRRSLGKFHHWTQVHLMYKHMKEEGGAPGHFLPPTQTLPVFPPQLRRSPVHIYLPLQTKPATDSTVQVTIRVGMVPCSTFHTNLGGCSHGPNQCEYFTPCTLRDDVR